MTTNHSSPSQTRGWLARSSVLIPSRLAASAPRTTVGRRSVAASRNRPPASSALVASSVVRSAAATRIPLVTASSTSSLRRTVASTVVIPAVDVTGPMRSATSRGLLGERGGLAEHRLARLHAQEVGAEGIDLGDEVGLARRRDADDGDHRGDADGDAERRQHRAQPPGAQSDDADAPEVADPQPAARVGRCVWS